MKRLLLLLACISTSSLFAQNPSFGDLVDTPCGELTVQQPDNWELYHTLTNTWDGEHDPSWCISVANSSSTHLELEAGSFEINRPVYIRHTAAEGMPLLNEHLYRFWTESTTGMDWQNTDFNEAGWTTGMAAEISYPGDEDSGTEPYAFWHQSNFAEDWMWGGETAANCVATSIFEGAEVTELIFKLIFLEQDVAYLGQAVCDVVWNQYLIDESNVSSYIWNSSMYVSDPGTVIAYNPDFGYPSVTNPSFLDLYPEPNTAEQQVIEVEVADYGSMHFQPYAFLRGGLLEGSFEDRHLLQITNNGSNDCVEIFFELVFPPNNSFVHVNGAYNVGPAGCMMFHRGATLEVAKNATMRYGHLGSGMLGLFEGAHVVLNQGSTLRIDNTIALWELEWLDNSQEIVIPLPEASLLAFGEFATFQDPPAGFKIKLLMQGGAVDFGGLSEEDRKLFELVWESGEASMPLLFTENPTAQPAIIWNAQEDAPLRINVYDASGRLVAEEQHVSLLGQQTVRLNTQLNMGMYTVVATQGTTVQSGRVLVE